MAEIAKLGANDMVLGITGTNGVTYNLDDMSNMVQGMTFSRTLNINPAADEIAGVQYQSIANALTYIGTQSPAPSIQNRWGLLVSGTLGENIDLGNMAYINIVGTGNTMLAGKVDNTGTCNGIKLNTLIAERQWSIYNCDMMDFSTSASSFSSLINCRIANGTPAANTAVLMDGCIIFDGDYSGVTIGFLERCIINHGTFGNPYGFVFRIDDSYVMGESTFNMSVIAINTIFEDSGAYHSTPSLNGGRYYGCLFLGGVHVNFPSDTIYTFDSSVFEDPQTFNMSGAANVQLTLKDMSHQGDITIGTSNKLTTNNCNQAGKVNVGEGGTWVNNGPHIIGGIGSFDHLEVPGKTPANAVAATGTLTASNTPSDGDTVTIGTVTYTFKTTLTPAEGEVLIGGSAAVALDNLKSAINHTGNPGTDYYCAAEHPSVTAAANTDTTQAVEAKIRGNSGNSIAVSTTAANLSWGTGVTTLTGGVDGTVGVAREVCMDASYVYYCVAANTVADANWRRMALSTSF